MVRTIRELEQRISKLERTPQTAFAAADVGAIAVTGSPSGSIKLLAGSNIPIELQNFYSFFNRTIYVCMTWSRIDGGGDYVYQAVTSDNNNPNTDAMFLSGGVALNFNVTHMTDFTIAFSTLTSVAPSIWYGLIGSFDFFFGSSIFTGSRMLFQEAGIWFDGFPQIRTWQMIDRRDAQASADLTLSTTPTDITGAIVSDILVPRGCVVKATGHFDFEETVAGTTVGIGDCVFDGGSVQTRKARFGMAAVTDVATITQTWYNPIANGSDFVNHNVKLQGSKTVAAGTQVIRAAHTSLTVEVYAQ
jgi:hypothetical protein